MERFVTKLSRALAVISALSIVVLVISITTEVVIRNITSSSVPGMVEIAESSLVVGVFFGLGWAAVRGEHVTVTILSDRVGPRANQVFHLVTWTLASAFLVWMVYATTQRAVRATIAGEERFGLLRWPLWPLRWVIALGLAVLLVVAVINMLRAFERRSLLGAEHEAELAQMQTAPVAVPVVRGDT